MRPMDRQDYSVPRLDSPNEKDQYLDAIFQGEEPFPWGNGGMGVGFSGENMVAAVMEEGGIGTLAGSAVGYNPYREGIYEEPGITSRVARYEHANQMEIARQIGSVRERMPNGILGVNVMAAMNDFPQMIDAIGKSEQADMVFVGAGLPRGLGEQVKQYPHMRYVPIVSSARAAKAMVKSGIRSGNLPSALYVELPQLAGGHLGAKDAEDAADLEKFDPVRLFREINEEIEKIVPGHNIALILAGGITYGSDMEAAREMGYSSGFMATRVLVTEESGVSNNLLTSRYLNKDYESKIVITSPAGLPSRCLGESPSDLEPEIAREARRECIACIGAGDRCQYLNKEGNGLYCIAKRLSQTQRGEEGGVLFTGARITDMREDDLYKDADQRVHIPTVKEALDFVFDSAKTSRQMAS